MVLRINGTLYQEIKYGSGSGELDMDMGKSRSGE